MIRDSRSPLVCGTPLDLGGARLLTSRAVVRRDSRDVAREQRWLHALVSSALGRDHRRASGACTPPDWSLVRWPAAPSGWAVAWWSEADAERLRCTDLRARLGRAEVACRLGPITRVAWLPVRRDAEYRVRVTTTTPVVNGHVEDGVAADVSLDAALRNAAATVARRLGVGHGPLAVRVVRDRSARLRVPLPGARAPLRAWFGDFVVACSADVRWLLDVAARGIGLGGRTAYGYGTVRVVDVVDRAEVAP